jgi:hypothetical protein
MWDSSEARVFNVQIISFLLNAHDANIKLATYMKSITAYHQRNNSLPWFNLWQWKGNRRKTRTAFWGKFYHKKKLCGLTENLTSTVTFIGAQNIYSPDTCHRRGKLNCCTMTQKHKNLAIPAQWHSVWREQVAERAG